VVAAAAVIKKQWELTCDAQWPDRCNSSSSRAGQWDHYRQLVMTLFSVSWRDSTSFHAIKKHCLNCSFFLSCCLPVVTVGTSQWVILIRLSSRTENFIEMSFPRLIDERFELYNTVGQTYIYWRQMLFVELNSLRTKSLQVSLPRLRVTCLTYCVDKFKQASKRLLQ